MNKEFEYRGYKFNINVKLNSRNGKRVNGKRWHEITTNSMNFDPYCKKEEEVRDEFLELRVSAIEVEVQEHIDNRIDKTNNTDKRLSDLGFK